MKKQTKFMQGQNPDCEAAFAVYPSLDHTNYTITVAWRDREGNVISIDLNAGYSRDGEMRIRDIVAKDRKYLWKMRDPLRKVAMTRVVREGRAE